MRSLKISKMLIALILALCFFLNTSLVHASTFPNILLHGPRTRKWIALTFDADMTPQMKKRLENGEVPSWYNEKVVQILRETQTPATFFLTGMWTEIYPDTARSFATDPLFEIKNHSYSHPSFSGVCYGLRQIPNDQKLAEVQKAQQVILEKTGVAPHYFRFPGGCAGLDDIRLVKSQNLGIVGWDVISGDAFSSDEAKIEKHVLKKVQNGSIVVFHLNGGPNAPRTADALEKIIPELKKRGFLFIQVKKMEGSK